MKPKTIDVTIYAISSLMVVALFATPSLLIVVGFIYMWKSAPGLACAMAIACMVTCYLSILRLTEMWGND